MEIFSSMCSPVHLLQSSIILGLSMIIHCAVQDECVDKYAKYCKRLKSHRCYLGFNRNLCCNTCRDYSINHGVYPYDNIDFCDFGDRKICSRMDTNYCYDKDYRISCCGTCRKARLNIPTCQYGDHDVSSCMKVKSHDCYLPEIAKKCCGTCSKYSTGRKGCQYGDRVKYFSKYKKRYNCVAYIGHFGGSRCFFDSGFIDDCCGSCYKKGVQWSYTSYG